MGDSDLEFYTREAYAKGDADGYARAVSDIARMLEGEREGMATMPLSDAREAEDRNMLMSYAASLVAAIAEGKHVGRTSK